MSIPIRQGMTPEEYLAFERAFRPKDGVLRHEFVDGELVSMAGASREHTIIVFNTAKCLDRQLSTKPCEVYSSEMRVQISAYGDYCYPDITLVCGDPRFVDGRRDTVDNPILIVEVLSPSTARYDRTSKFEACKSIPELRHYILIDQHQPLLEHFERLPGDKWAHAIYFQLESTAVIRDPDCELPLREIYDRIAFVEPNP